MALDEPLLVRCAGCARNFETRRTGRLRCPICRTEIWLEPPPGQAPDRAEDAAPETPSPAPPARPEPPPAAVHPADAPEPHPGADAPAPPDAPLADVARPSPLAEVVPIWESGPGRAPGRFVATCRQILTNPPRFFHGLQVDRLGNSWTFAWLLCSLAAVFVSLYGLWNLESSEAALLEALRAQPDTKPEEAVALLRSLFTFGLWAAPLLGLANVWGTALLIHLGVVLTNREHRGFKATFRATAYGFAPLILVVVPVIGQLVGSLWSIVLQVVAIAHVHRLSPGRAALAVLVPMTAVLGLLLAFV
jgi:hypothetical protein